ncbi:MAG: hypothetical protein R3E79_46645 [Caldilineaceae bacterium]
MGIAAQREPWRLTADDGAAITVTVNFATDDTAANPEAGTFANQLFLPLINWQCGQKTGDGEISCPCPLSIQ